VRSIAPVPDAGQPVAAGWATVAITAVGTDVDSRAPSAFVAVTVSRSVLPASTCLRT
jgi:hypothetical protein